MEKSILKTNSLLNNNPDECEIFYKIKGERVR